MIYLTVILSVAIVATSIVICIIYTKNNNIELERAKLDNRSIYERLNRVCDNIYHIVNRANKFENSKTNENTTGDYTLYQSREDILKTLEFIINCKH